MREASEETVALYRYVFHHGPVTFDEIVEKALPPAMRSAAYQAYTAYRAEEGEDLPEEYYKIERNKDFAWRWWVGELVGLSAISKRLITSTQDGSPKQGKRRHQLLYSAGKAPMVRTAGGKMVPWSPESDQAYARAIAAQRVVQRGEEAIAKAASIPDRKDRDLVVKVLRDALEAIRVSK